MANTTIANPQILEKGTKAYEMLEFACAELTRLTNGTLHIVQNVFEDVDADIKWSTITTNDKSGSSYQLLSPRDWLLLVNGPNEHTLPLIKRLAEDHL